VYRIVKINRRHTKEIDMKKWLFLLALLILLIYYSVSNYNSYRVNKMILDGWNGEEWDAGWDSTPLGESAIKRELQKQGYVVVPKSVLLRQKARQQNAE